MRRWFPYPILSLCLLGLWLLLNQSTSPGQIVLGAMLSVAGGWLLARVQAPRQRVRNLRAMIKLAFVVLIDIVRSNAAVAAIIFGSRRRRITSDFIHIPLDIRNPYALSVLACIITATPGTLWVKFDSSSGLLLMHVLDFLDEKAWIETVKGRYESLLKEIYE